MRLSAQSPEHDLLHDDMLQFQQFPSKVEEGEATDQVMQWIRDGVIDLKDYISDYFDFENILDAFEKLEKREISKKGIIVYNRENR